MIEILCYIGHLQWDSLLSSPLVVRISINATILSKISHHLSDIFYHTAVLRLKYIWSQKTHNLNFKIYIFATKLRSQYVLLKGVDPQAYSVIHIMWTSSLKIEVTNLSKCMNIWTMNLHSLNKIHVSYWVHKSITKLSTHEL